MQVRRIPKKGGGYRTIYMLDPMEREEVAVHKSYVRILMRRVCGGLFVHGFMPGRSAVSNASMHIGYQYSLSMDIRDFFDHVTHSVVRNSVKSSGQLPGVHSHYSVNWTRTPTEMPPEVMFPDGVARQGIPTSPFWANIAASTMDDRLLNLRHFIGQFSYSRYADDLTFSTNDKTVVERLREEVPRVVQEMGFEINRKKTRLQSASYGRRIITGVAVSEGDVHPTRKMRRRLRAAHHQQNEKQINGLSGWVATNVPASFVYESDRVREL